MKRQTLKNWLKRISITLFLALSFSVAITYAAPSIPNTGSGQTGTAFSLNTAYAADEGAADQNTGLGLQIPGEAQISPDIVQTSTFGALVINIVDYFVGFLGTIAVIMFIYAGVLMVIAGGDEQLLTKAKKIMTYAAIGLVVVIISYSAVRFITGAGQESLCNNGKGCESGTVCQQNEKSEWRCKASDQLCGGGCTQGEWCVLDGGDYVCESSSGPGQLEGCHSSADCKSGEWCSANLTCVAGSDTSCMANEECESPKTCDMYGFCRNPDANAGSSCKDNTDCPSKYVCNMDTNKCEAGGTGIGGVEGGPSQAAAEEALNNIAKLVTDLTDLLDGIGDDVDGLSDKDKAALLDALNAGMLADKMAGIQTLMDKTTDPKALEVMDKVMEAMEKLKDLREELDGLRLTMPESAKTIESWDKTSEALDNLIDDPLNNIKLRRFEKEYRELQDLIRKFPVVKSKIHAAPGEGNVPFTVTLDGMDSEDPTGGTISDYKWSYLDASGNSVSLGNEPVIVHEFTGPNTYSVRLQVSTSQTDADGYKTAMDGVSFVRVRANPPASQVAFKINGVQALDVYHVTLEEAQAGIAFDPSITVPALGRTIEKYEWLYGDAITEERSTPTAVVHSYNKAGEFFVTLKVTDNHGITDKRIIKLFVKSLAADIEVKPSDGNVNTEFSFRGVNSRSDDGSIKEYQWEINDPKGNTIAEKEEESFTYKFDSPGEYKVYLTVTDITGAKDKYLKILKISSRDPVASFTYDIPAPNHPNRVEFSALNSYDPDAGDKITYSWDFDGDGNFDIIKTNDINVTHEYKKTGEYRITLQAEDAFGQHNQIQKGISIDSVLSGDIVIPKRSAQVNEEVVLKADSPNSVAYLWEFGDGETINTDQPEVTYKYNKKGKYRVKMNFFDEEDNENSDTAFMLIGNQDYPVAAATVTVNGRDHGFTDDLCGEGKNGIVVNRADNLMLSAKDSVNTDGSGRMLSYDWRLADGTTNSRKEFSHRFSEVNREGECFSASLVVRDQVSGKLSDEDVIYFKVINELPTIIDFVIEAGEQKELVTPAKIILKAIGPKDPDGQVKKYRWWYYREGYEDEMLGVHSTSAPQTEMIITAQGEPDTVNRYHFVLEVMDNDGGIYNSFERFGEFSYLDIKNGPNLSPVAEFIVDKTTVSVGDSITFISQSYDPQGDEMPNDAYKWDFDGDGEFDDTSTGPQVNRQYNTPGEYTVRLKVVYRGLSSSATKTVFVEQVQSLPQAAFTYEIDGSTVKFDAGNSRYDPNLSDTTLRYEWDFDITKDANGNGINDDDVESTEMAPSYAYSDLGTYRVRLKVKDILGMEGVVVRDVNLSMSAADRQKNTYQSIKVNSPNQPITALNVAIMPVQVSKGDTADISVNVINADGSPYYGQVFFEIAEGSGELSPNPVQAKDSKASAIFTAADPGSVRIKVRATDTYYGEIIEEVVLTVK
jgi:PKD repeat protein